MGLLGAALLMGMAQSPQLELPPACAAEEQGIRTARNQAPEPSYSLTVVFEAVEPWCHGWTVVQVLHRWDGSQSRWEMKRTHGSGDAPNASPVVSWARSEDCPAMLEPLTGLERLPMRFGLGAPVREGAPPGMSSIRPPMLDGTYYTIESQSLIVQPSDAFASLRLSSNEGEVARWVEDTLSRLDGCWR
jgi:hypothetical protein